jgi:hypothetical protein
MKCDCVFLFGRVNRHFLSLLRERYINIKIVIGRFNFLLRTLNGFLEDKGSPPLKSLSLALRIAIHRRLEKVVHSSESACRWCDNDAILDPLESPLTQTDDDPGRVSEVVSRLTS